MSFPLSYEISGIDGTFKIPVNQNDEVKTISALIRNNFSIIPKISAKIFGSDLQSTAILSESVDTNDVVIFSPKYSEDQLNMSQQIIITPRYQSQNTFIVFSTINFASMTIGDMIKIDNTDITKDDIESQIIIMLNQKYKDETGCEIKKIILFLPGGIPFFDNATLSQFIQTFPHFASHLYAIVLYDDKIKDSILSTTIENIQNIRDEPMKALLSPYFESEMNGLCDISYVLNYIQSGGLEVDSLIYSIAKFVPFAPLINGLYGLRGKITGLTVIQVTAPLSILFVEMNKNLQDKKDMLSSSANFIAFFMNIKVSDQLPCTRFNRPFYNVGYEKFLHETIEKNEQIESVIAFNPDFEEYDWIRFQLPSLTEDDLIFAIRNTKLMNIKNDDTENSSVQAKERIYNQPIYLNNNISKEDENQNEKLTIQPANDNVNNKNNDQSENSQIKMIEPDMMDQLFKKKTFLGQGATSTVYKVSNIFTHKGFLCLKVLNDEFINLSRPKKKKSKSIWDEEEEDESKEEEDISFDFDKVKRLFLEYEFLSNLNHQNIVKVHGFFYGNEDHNPAILLEYCKFNLEEVINDLDDADLVGIIYEICSAMKYVHEKKIIHRDLKMKNILINIKKHVKICDFGISKAMHLTTYTSTTHGVGTLPFMAPEIFHEDGKYDEKVDVYAFGVVMYYIVTKGEMPKMTGFGNYESVKLPSKINQLSSSIIKSCWSSSPTQRPSFDILLKLIIDNEFMLVDGIENEIPKIRKHLGID